MCFLESPFEAASAAVSDVSSNLIDQPIAVGEEPSRSTHAQLSEYCHRRVAKDRGKEPVPEICTGG